MKRGQFRMVGRDSGRAAATHDSPGFGSRGRSPHQKLKRQSLWKISVTTTPEAEDAVSELLSAILNQPATAYFDVETGVSTVTVYLRQQPNLSREGREVVSTGLKQIRRCGLRIGSGKIVMTKVRRQDWAESWKRHFQPIEIGFTKRRDKLRDFPVRRKKSRTSPFAASAESLLIKPSWSKRKPRKGQALMVLDPGLSFGTGQHPTTAFCLHQIVSAIRDRWGRRSQSAAARKSFLDLGTGSGILAIAAAKLGYSPVHAMDFDPESIRVAKANARTNHVLPKVKIRRGDVTKLPVRPGHRGHGYDLVCANLLTDLLISQGRRIAAQLKPDGTLVLAGILKLEFVAVQRAYATMGLGLVSRRVENEWCSGSFRFDS